MLFKGCLIEEGCSDIFQCTYMVKLIKANTVNSTSEQAHTTNIISFLVERVSSLGDFDDLEDCSKGW